MKKQLIIWLMLIILVATSACSLHGSSETGQRPRQRTLTLGVLPDVDSVPFIIAQEKGFFREQGLTVKLQPFKSALERDSALQSANLDGAVSDILAVAFAKDGGFNTVITSLTNGSYKLLAHPGTGAISITDLRAQSVGISKNTLIEYLTDTMLATAGLQPNDIDKVIISQIPARLELLNSGKISAATLPEPLAAMAVQKGAILIDSSDSLQINPGVLVFTSAAIREKSREIQAMYQAYNQAVDYLTREPAANYIDLIIEKGSFPPAVKGNIVMPVYTKAAAPDPQEITRAMQWLQARQLIKQTYSYQELVDTRFVR